MVVIAMTLSRLIALYCGFQDYLETVFFGKKIMITEKEKMYVY